MAILNQHATKMFADPSAYLNETKPRTVGNNRCMLVHDHGNIEGSFIVFGALHGNKIIRVDYINHQPKLISLDTCGWLTVATQAAMNDFISALPARISHNFSGVGRAKGELSVIYGGVNHVDPDGSSLEIWV